METEGGTTGTEAVAGVDPASLEAQIARVRGVRSVRVTPEPLTLHLSGTGTRSPEEVTRDVRSLVAAAFGILLEDASIVIGAESAQPTEPSGGPKLEWLNVANDGDTARIDVGVSWHGEEAAGGAISRSGGKKSRALAAAQAAATALGAHLSERRMTATVGAVETLTVGGREWVVVAVEVDDGEGRRHVLGSALLEADAVVAGAGALLDAMHRILT